MRVLAGGERKVMAFAYVKHATCQSEVPVLRLLIGPSHGTGRVTKVRETISAPSHPCFGRSIEKALLTYRPRPGSLSQDRILLARWGTPSSPAEETIEITLTVLPGPGSASPAPPGKDAAPPGQRNSRDLLKEAQSVNRRSSSASPGRPVYLQRPSLHLRSLPVKRGLGG